jgi:phosphonate transport system substrate-binding protein
MPMPGDNRVRAGTVLGTFRLAACALAVILAVSALGCESRETAIPVDFSRREEPVREAPPKAVTYAYLPQYSHRVSLTRHHMLVEYLKRATGLPVRQVFPDTFDEHVRMVGQGKIDISFVNPVVYASMRELHGALAFARALEYPPAVKSAPGAPRPEPVGTFRGQIIARAGNQELRSIEDCRGKRWIAVDPSSAGGYLYPLGLFAKNGLRPADFAEIAFAPGPGGKQEKVVMAVLAGGYDVGSIREGTLDVVAGAVDVSNIKVLAVTPPYPGWVFCARQGVDPEALGKIKAALLALDPSKPGDAAILDKADIARIAAASDPDFDPVRELIALLGPDAR